MWEKLLASVQNNDEDELKKILVANKANVELTDSTYECNILHWACIYKKEEIACLLIREYPALLKGRCMFGRLPLHYASRHGNVKIVQELISNPECQDDINSLDNDKMTPLLLAAREDELTILQVLASHDNCKIETIQTAIFFSINKQLSENVKILVTEAKIKATHIGLQRLTINNYQPNQISIIDQILLTLLDSYLRLSKLRKWEIKWRGAIVQSYENRDLKLGLAEGAHCQRYERHSNFLAALKWAIGIIENSLTHYNDSELRQYYSDKVSQHKQYFASDDSDDSDSDDEIEFNKQSSAKRASKHLNISGLLDNNFWIQTRRTSVQKKGFGEHLGYMSKKMMLNKFDIAQGKDKLLGHGYLQERATLQIDVKKFPKEFVAQFRGVGYMPDRWSDSARRYHYRMDEVGLPQFSESALKQLPFDFYTELDTSNDYYKSNFLTSLMNDAIKISTAYREYQESTPFLANTVRPKSEYYVFDNVADYLQHGFSNGISQHLLEVHNYRQYDPQFQVLPNSFNYAIAAGDRPYHSLKYATGLKDYYEYEFELQYDQDGRLKHSHAGKVYVILHELEEFLTNKNISRVIQKNHAGQVPVDRDILPELETSFIGHISSEKIVYQFEIKFPPFHKEYKKIYEIKYGMDIDLYSAFQVLIRNVPIESPLRSQVINLLREWLCSYIEVLLIKIAQQEAQKREGTLVYINHNNQAIGKPDVRASTRGHTDEQNRQHTCQNTRWLLGRMLSTELSPGQSMGILTQDQVSRYLDQILDSIAYQDRIGEGIKIEDVSALRTQIINRQISEGVAKRQIAMPFIEETRRHLIAPRVKSQRSHGVTYLNHPNHLYTDSEINLLLSGYLADVPSTTVIAAQHPLIRGVFSNGSRNIFIQAIQTALRSNNVTIIPINLTQQTLSSRDQIPIVGTHWVGVVVRKEGDSYVIEYMDSLNNLESANLVRDLVSRAATSIGGNFRVNILQTNQQWLDVDCGAWMVDNVIRRAQQLPLQNNQQTTGVKLRNSHNEALVAIFTVDRQAVNTRP